MKLFLTIAAIYGLLAVAIGAFGAHSLKDKLTPYALGVYEKAVLYQMFHTLALLGVAILIKLFPGTGILTTAAWAFTFGIFIFSGSLYTLAISGQKFWGAITPIGGVTFIVGWAHLLYFSIKNL